VPLKPSGYGHGLDDSAAAGTLAGRYRVSVSGGGITRRRRFRAR